MKSISAMVLCVFLLGFGAQSTRIECALDGESMFMLDTIDVEGYFSIGDKDIEVICSKKNDGWRCESMANSKKSYVVNISLSYPMQGSLKEFFRKQIGE